MQEYHLFIPGRLCLFGEHSDWAGFYRSINAEIPVGQAIVTGIEEGVYARVTRAKSFIIRSEIAGEEQDSFESPMELEHLLKTAQCEGYYSYVAGVASYIKEHYDVGGVEITITERTLPVKRGLSSSAAICVLVARAFNQLYRLRMSTRGEMLAAYYGEQRTPSRCGRLDQACAFGTVPIAMTFDGSEISVQKLKLKKEIYLVFADLMAKKDTIQILGDLNRCYPFAQTPLDSQVHAALGAENQQMVAQAIEALQSGDAQRLGDCMTRAQLLFDQKIAPASPEQLCAPALHKVLANARIKTLTYGGKGVGSQGDGSVQFVARDKQSQQELLTLLREQHGMDAYSLTLKATHGITRAIIPTAGYGTRHYPATKLMRKEFFPVVDQSGVTKPAVLVLLEELDTAGIEEICLVVNEGDEALYKALLHTPLTSEHAQKLSADQLAYEGKMRRLWNKLRFVRQDRALGFGYAVWLCQEFAGNEPVLLLLGDTLFTSHSEHSCVQQLLHAYDETPQLMVGLTEVPETALAQYGVLCGSWCDGKRRREMEVSSIVEKPTVDFARRNLMMQNRDRQDCYYGIFGSYILTPAIFARLGRRVTDYCGAGEIPLTDVLEEERVLHGMRGVVIEGESLDIGNPQAYVASIPKLASTTKEIKIKD